MRARRYALSAVLSCVAAMTACTAPAEFPTLDEATRRLTADAESLQLQVPVAERVTDGACVAGEVRGFVRAELDASAGPLDGSAGLLDASAGLLERLQAMGYDKIVDDLDLRDEDQDVVVLRHPRTRLTFEVTAGEGPGEGQRVVVVGKTTCYAAG
ncbi:hypothetical protein ITP53_45860 [Nonomuraea sp. K274]|uniref:Lipoprotein n=1 Tax=Nonomuraea cypriaca TaxID=1187855 RepID=A0A931AJJ4_9ACTN|nr:hypothetical protein [Nonomuraea cypriaca]MBF8192885.1 hypothetical protein [Nonomuraea cypriaca]